MNFSRRNDDAAVAAVAGANIDLGFVEEFHGSSVARAGRAGEDDAGHAAAHDLPPWFPTPPPQQSDRRAALAGIVLMLAGIFLFSVNDALGKWLVATYSVGQVLLIRSAAALVLLAPFIWRDRATLRAGAAPGLQALRALFSPPLEVALLLLGGDLSAARRRDDLLSRRADLSSPRSSALFLREQVGWRRWSAVIVGFIGVIIVPAARLGGAERAGADRARRQLLVLASMIVTRPLRGTSDTVLVTTRRWRRWCSARCSRRSPG